LPNNPQQGSKDKLYLSTHPAKNADAIHSGLPLHMKIRMSFENYPIPYSNELKHGSDNSTTNASYCIYVSCNLQQSENQNWMNRIPLVVVT
jgi:hypothetical protein